MAAWAVAGRMDEEARAIAGEFLPGQGATRVTRSRYRENLSGYAERYATDERQIKRWIARGRSRAPQDLPPLDAPREMLAWWSRNMKWKVPDRLLQAAGGVGVDDPPPATVLEVEAKAPMQSGLGQHVGTRALPEGSGFVAALDRAREAERVAFGAWQHELQRDPPDSGAEEMRHRAWQRAVETVRKMEISSEDVLAASGQFVRAKDYETSDDEVKAVLHQSLRSLIVRVATKVGLPPEWFQRVNHAYQAELDHTFEKLAASDYAEPFELRAA